MFLVIKMYPREGPDSNITNYTHAKAGTGKGGQLSHPIPIFHQRGPLLPGSLCSVSPSAPAGFISFLTELGPCGHGFNWPLVSIFIFPDPLPSAVCPPANLQLRIPPSNPSLCRAPLEPSPAGMETHTTPQVDIVKEWGLLTSLNSSYCFWPFLQWNFPKSSSQGPKTPSSRGQVWIFFSFSSLLPLETALPTSRAALPPRQIGHRTLGLSSRVPGRSGKISPETATTCPWGKSPLISWDSNPNLTWIPTRW